MSSLDQLSTNSLSSGTDETTTASGTVQSPVLSAKLIKAKDNGASNETNDENIDCFKMPSLPVPAVKPGELSIVK